MEDGPEVDGADVAVGVGVSCGSWGLVESAQVWENGGPELVFHGWPPDIGVSEDILGTNSASLNTLHNHTKDPRQRGSHVIPRSRFGLVPPRSGSQPTLTRESDTRSPR